MKKIEVSDQVHAALQDLAVRSRRTPDEVLASLLNLPDAAEDAADPLAAFILGAEFRALPTDAGKYLALLGWVARRHPADFAEFIRSLEGGRRYLGLSRAEVLAACAHNQARQIDGTCYWAVMNLDRATQRRFLARVLEFAGYRESVIDFACAAIGMCRPPPRGRLFVH